MVPQQVSLNDLALLLPRQGVEYFSQFAPCLAKQHLAPSLRASHIMRTFLTRSRFTILGTLSLESLYAFRAWSLRRVAEDERCSLDCYGVAGVGGCCEWSTPVAIRINPVITATAHS